MKIALVGEAWGEEEEKEGRSLVGSSGFILNNMLSQVGIVRSECLVTSVFNLRPRPSNDIINLCGGKSEAVPNRPSIIKGKYIRKEFSNELDRLEEELRTAAVNVVVALGATASWALLDSSGIRAIRGAADWSHRYGVKVVPTYHPSAVAREWTLRPVVIADLHKAKRESETAELNRPQRHIWISPTLEDLARYEQEHIINAPRLSIDIETKGDQITCIGFAPSPTSAIVIPFYSADRKGNYWPDAAAELTAWDYVRRWCQYPAVFQNGLYDIQFLWRRYGIPVPLATHDTMLLHHSLQPEMEKGLGFLGSIYTSEASWKFMRKTDTIKKGD